jgi:hypothetical protein
MLLAERVVAPVVHPVPIKTPGVRAAAAHAVRERMLRGLGIPVALKFPLGAIRDQLEAAGTVLARQAHTAQLAPPGSLLVPREHTALKDPAALPIVLQALGARLALPPALFAQLAVLARPVLLRVRPVPQARILAAQAGLFASPALPELSQQVAPVLVLPAHQGVRKDPQAKLAAAHALLELSRLVPEIPVVRLFLPETIRAMQGQRDTTLAPQVHSVLLVQ